MKLFSFVMAGRDDGYHADYLYRIETTVNTLAAGAERCGRLEDVEAVLIDWAGRHGGRPEAVRSLVDLLPRLPGRASDA